MSDDRLTNVRSSFTRFLLYIFARATKKHATDRRGSLTALFCVYRQTKSPHFEGKRINHTP